MVPPQRTDGRSGGAVGEWPPAALGKVESGGVAKRYRAVLCGKLQLLANPQKRSAEVEYPQPLVVVVRSPIDGRRAATVVRLREETPCAVHGTLSTGACV